MQKEIDKVDDKNVSIAKQLLGLRHSIDVHRIIGLNVESIKETAVANSFFAHIQTLSLHHIAIGFSKLFEYSSRNELDSIPAILKNLPDKEVDGSGRLKISSFGSKYGHENECTDCRIHLKATCALFRETHEQTLSRLRHYRDKKGAHAESNVMISGLPSHDEFEFIFEFCRGFYEIVSEYYIDVFPALLGRQVGFRLIDLLKNIGVEDPKYDFQNEQA